MNAVEGWVTKQFDEIGTIFSGSTPSTSIHAFWNGEIVWVTPYDLSRLNTPYLSDSAKRITMKGLGGCSAHLLPAGSIVMSSRAPIGYVAIPTVDFCTNQGCKSIQLKDDFTSEFTYYNILFNIAKVKNLGEGTTFAEISKNALSKIELDFPPSKPEQTKIAEILSTVDRAIEQTEALIAKQQRIKTGLMQDLLTRGIDEHGNLRSEQTHEFKDSPLGRIPVEWEVVTAGEVSKSLVPGRDKPELDGGGVPWITMPDIEEMYIEAAKTGLSLSLNAIRAANARLMPKGTVLMSCVGEFGIATIATVDVVANQQLHGFICDQNVLSEWFLVQITGAGKRIDRMATQTTIKYLNKTGCELILIAVPDRHEQERSVALLRRVINLLTQQQKHLAKFQAIKTALMQDLLTGKKRVTTLLNDTGGTNV